MQWADDVIGIVNSVLATMPARYKKKIYDGLIKEMEERVSVESMIEMDPTEGVRSEEIIPLSERYFTILERKEYGGAILMPLFMNIVSNFDASREEDRIIMDFCLLLEKTLLESGIIPANGMLMVCGKK